MKINKSDFMDSLSFLLIAMFFFLVTIDIVFPFVMFMMKMIFYILGSLMFVLAIGTMVRSIFGNKNNINP